MYLVRFVRRDRKPNEEHFYNNRQDASHHLNLFQYDDSVSVIGTLLANLWSLFFGLKPFAFFRNHVSKKAPLLVIKRRCFCYSQYFTLLYLPLVALVDFIRTCDYN